MIGCWIGSQIYEIPESRFFRLQPTNKERFLFMPLVHIKTGRRVALGDEVQRVKKNAHGNCPLAWVVFFEGGGKAVRLRFEDGNVLSVKPESYGMKMASFSECGEKYTPPKTAPKGEEPPFSKEIFPHLAPLNAEQCAVIERGEHIGFNRVRTRSKPGGEE